MSRILNPARGIPHRFLAFGIDHTGGQLAANSVVEEKAGILEALKGRLWDETVLVQAAEKGSSDRDPV